MPSTSSVDSVVFTSLDVSNVQPDAVLFLGNPLVSQYEVDVYLSLWRRLHQHQQQHNTDTSTSSSMRRSVPFVCTDGSWKKLVKEEDILSGGASYPFHLSCGDMDSQPPPHHLTAGIPRISAPTVADLTADQLSQLQAHIDGSTTAATPPPYLIVPITNDQDTTDFDKCLSLVKHLLQKRGPSTSTSSVEVDRDSNDIPLVLVVGALGGRFDHTMAVITSIIRVRDDMRVVVHNASNTLFCCARRGMTKFHHSPKLDGRSCGVMVFGDATSSVVTTGLEWNLGDPSLVTGFLGMCLSTSNNILPSTPQPPTSSDHTATTSVPGDESTTVTIDTSPVPNEGRKSAVIFSVERGRKHT